MQYIYFFLGNPILYTRWWAGEEELPEPGQRHSATNLCLIGRLKSHGVPSDVCRPKLVPQPGKWIDFLNILVRRLSALKVISLLRVFRYFGLADGAKHGSGELSEPSRFWLEDHLSMDIHGEFSGKPCCKTPSIQPWAQRLEADEQNNDVKSVSHMSTRSG